MQTRDSFLGTGWGFPVSFRKGENAQNCAVVMVKAALDIQQSLTILFSTRPGERVMRPNFGGSLEDLLFEPVTTRNAGLITYIKELISNAILYYEPRIDLENIEIDTEEGMEGKVKIALTFSIRTTNSRFNYVYDYYKQEGTIAPI